LTAMLIQAAPKIYTEADFAKFIEKITEQKVEFSGGEFIPVHGTEPLPSDLVDYILGNEFDEKELTYQFPMSTEQHDIIIENTTGMLFLHARQTKKFHVFAQGTMVYIPLSGKIRIPDVVIVEKANHQRDELHRVLSPLVTIEVLSKSTQMKDKFEKLEEYQSIASLQSYILISQEQPLVTIYTRLGEDIWQQQVLKGLDREVTITSLDFALRLKDIYEGIEFAEVGA
jgi:Uma2 family endonuclease